MVKTFGNLQVEIYETRREMGKAAAKRAGEILRRELEEKQEITCVFAAAPSQNEFLEELVHQEGIDWNRINACHMDEYIGIEPGTEGSFSHFLDEAIFLKVPFHQVYRIQGTADLQEECDRYTQLWNTLKPDVVFMGIGENGHIAFNDPPIADFRDPKIIKPVKLEIRCRKQQVHDGCFPNLEAVPTHALTVTIPALLSCRHVICVVPGERKAQAVRDSLLGPVHVACPASILREKKDAVMYLDQDSASLL